MFDITNICRICLSEEYPKLPIFTDDDEKSESKPTLPEKIMSFAQVKVVKDDGLPMYICVKCYCQVDTTVEFKRLCEESFHYFKRQLDIFSNLRATSPSLQVDKENFDGEHHILPEDCIKVEEYVPEDEVGEEPGTQVFRITGCDESWVKGDEVEFDASVIKCEASLDYQNIEFDLCNVKIENCSENWSDEEHVNPLEINLEDFDDPKTPVSDGLTSTSNIEKTCKCRSCEMVFSNRREMGFHISFAHRRCNVCATYFYSNKDKDEHVCGKASETSRDEVDQFCHICNKTVKQIKSHMSSHLENKTNDADTNDTETSMEKDSFATPTQIKPESEMTDVRIKCSLCDVVCLDENAFKVHLKCIHSGHRIIYPCYLCKSRKFFSKMSCIKHLTKKHGVAANKNIQFELSHIDSDASTNAGQQRKFKKTDYKSKMEASPKTQCHEQTQDNNLGRKVSEQGKPKEKKTKISPRKCLKQSHPPFSHAPPIIRNNFNVTLDHKGIKRYVCRGCDVVYKGYVAAYNHYYTYSKRKTTAEDDVLIVDSKPYGCKLCKLKFASGSQAMMHRIHAHKYFYKKCAIEKR